MSGSFYVFADESGTEKSAEYCIIAGYIGAPRQWQKFRRAWRKVLHKYGVPEFHAKDFYQRERRKRVPHYEGWSDDKAGTFLAALLKIINERDIDPLSVAIHVPSFNSFSHDERRYLSGGVMKTRVRHTLGSDEVAFMPRGFLSSGAPSRPYLGVFQRFIGEALMKARDGTQVHFTFDTNNLLQARAVQTFQEQFKSGHLPADLEAKAQSITYADSAKEEPLQAADLHAYAWNRVLGNKTDGRLMKQTVAAMGEKAHRMSVFNRKDLEEIFEHTVRGSLREGASRIKRLGLW